jgi:hypothetical protein
MSFNDEPRFSTCSMVAMACWTATLVLLFAAWIAWVVNPFAHFANLTASSACVMSAVAAVMQIRVYSARVCRLIRVTGGLERPEAEVREFSGPRR